MIRRTFPNARQVHGFKNNVVSTLARRHNVAKTLIRRYFDVMCLLVGKLEYEILHVTRLAFTNFSKMHIIKCEYDKEITQPDTANQPMAPRENVTRHQEDNLK